MTHDELLAKISIPIIFKAGVEQADIVNIVLLVKERQALRAIVGLHKPIGTNSLACKHCDSFSNEYSYSISYPCPTIQAIEGQLK